MTVTGKGQSRCFRWLELGVLIGKDPSYYPDRLNLSFPKKSTQAAVEKEGDNQQNSVNWRRHLVIRGWPNWDDQREGEDCCRIVVTSGWD